MTQKCPACRGTGIVSCPECSGSGVIMPEEPTGRCPQCGLECEPAEEVGVGWYRYRSKDGTVLMHLAGSTECLRRQLEQRDAEIERLRAALEGEKR